MLSCQPFNFISSSLNQKKKAISLELNVFSFIFSSLLATLLFMHHERGAKQAASDWEVESLSTCYILYLYAALPIKSLFSAPRFSTPCSIYFAKMSIRRICLEISTTYFSEDNKILITTTAENVKPYKRKKKL